MQNRLVAIGILFVGLLWQTAVTAQSVTRNAGATASSVTILVTQRASDTFDFEGSATASPGASITSYAWSFGDGTTASGSKASHRYAAAGWYQVSLTVGDSMRVTASTSTTVVAAAGGGDSTSTGPTSLGIDLVIRGPRFGFTARATPAANSTLKSYSWNFGDGETASGAAVAHYYKASGTYTAVLTVVDSNGGASTTTKIVNASLGNLSPGTTSPLASISSSPKSSDTYDFNAAPSRSRVAIASYAWNFGDGTTAAGPAVSHRYMSSGTYTVTLTAIASGGASSIATESVSASVVNSSPPTASIIATATASDTFTFSSTASASSGATVVSYGWNFGDGVTATGPTASHRYSASGTYAVVLTVVDSKGASGTATKSVAATVGTSPPSVILNAVQAAVDTYDFTGAATAFGGATIASYAWDFGDGSTASGAATSHRYSTSGTFPVVLTVLDSKGASGTATKSVTATVSGPPTASGRVRISNGDTNWLNASNALLAPWVKGGGDWFDKNGVFNGPTPTISIPIPANAPISINISGIDGDLLLTGIYGWDNPIIDGQPAVGFGVDSSSNQSQPLPSHWNNPGMILNPARGKVLTITPIANPLGQTLRIDKVAGPVINDYPTYVGASNTPDVWALEMIDEATIRARTAGGGRIDDPFAYKPEFGVEANGLKYLRTAITPGNQRDISWRLPYPSTTAVHTRFCIYLEDDIADGMTELGVKMMAGASNEAVGPTQPMIVYRINHGHQSPNNRGVYALYDYLYDAESGPSFPEGHSINAMARAGRWYCIEQAVRLNTGKGVHDGYGELWINGHSVWSTNTAYYRDDGTTTLTNFFANLYHGGMGYPSADIHYRIAKLAVSSTYIGVPQELLGAQPPSGLPAWRRSLTQKDAWGTATVSNFVGAGGANGQIAEWSGFAAHNGKVWAGLGGGHAPSGNVINDMWTLDLNKDTPQWTRLNPGSSPANYRTDYPYYVDGLPGTRHTYYSPQFITGVNGAHDRVMYFGNGGYGGESIAPDGDAGKAFVDGFDLVTNTWDAKGTWTNILGDVSWGSPTAVNPVTEDVWIYTSGYTGNIFKWTKATSTWAQVFYTGGFPQSWWYKPMLIDGTRNRLVLWPASGTSLGVLDLASLVGTTQPTTGWPASTSFIGDYWQFIHDTINDRYLLAAIWNDGSSRQRQSLFAIDPITWAVTYLNELPDPVWLPAKAANGIFGRLQLHPTLSGLSWTPHGASPTYFMPTR